jgi:hypothetical protein
MTLGSEADMRRWRETGMVAIVGALALAGVGAARSPVPESRAPAATAAIPGWLRLGAPALRSAGALAFTADGLLLVGDSRGAAVFALDVRDAGAPAGDTVSVQHIDEQVAARLGTTAADIAINDLAVHPRSHAVYLSVSRGLGADAAPAIVRVGAGARIDVVPLDRIGFAKATLPNPPAPGAKDDDGNDASSLAITNLAVAGGSVLVAGLANDEFASTLRRIPIPFTGAVATTGLRIYHTHHSRFETRSPITALVPYRAGGRDYILASYACTPLALFALDSLKDGAKVTGRTIAELGAGTHATDLVTYDWQGRRYLAVATVGRSLQLLEADDLAAAPALDSTSHPARGHPLSSWFTWGVRAYPGAQPGVLHLSDFDATYGEVLQRDVSTGALNLRPLRKPILW